MVQRLGPWAVTSQDQYVEAVLVAGAAVLEDPAPGHPLQHAPLPGAHRLLTSPEPVGAPRLDLNEGHEIGAPGNEIEIMVAEPIAMRLDPPTAAYQPAAGGNLGLPAIAMARVGPFCWGNARRGHARMMADRS